MRTAKPPVTDDTESSQANPEAPNPAREAVVPDLASIILTLLLERGPGKSICPSEAARTAGSSPGEADWKATMRAVRAAAATLQDDGRLVTLRKGRVVDIRTVKGVIRLGLPPTDV